MRHWFSSIPIALAIASAVSRARYGCSTTATPMTAFPTPLSEPMGQETSLFECGARLKQGAVRYSSGRIIELPETSSSNDAPRPKPPPAGHFAQVELFDEAKGGTGRDVEFCSDHTG